MATKFLPAEKLDEAIRQVSEMAASENKRAVLVGGAAMQLYGSDRLTADVDFAVSDLLAGLPARGRPLTFGGVSAKTANGVTVDLILRDDEFKPLYDDAIQKAVVVEGVPIPVVSPEHLAAMKMASGREKDMLDLSYLLTSGRVDHKAARVVIKEHMGWYAAREFDTLVEEAEWMKTRNNPRARRFKR